MFQCDIYMSVYKIHKPHRCDVQQSYRNKNHNICVMILFNIWAVGYLTTLCMIKNLMRIESIISKLKIEIVCKLRIDTSITPLPVSNSTFVYINHTFHNASYPRTFTSTAFFNKGTMVHCLTGFSQSKLLYYHQIKTKSALI